AISTLPPGVVAGSNGRDVDIGLPDLPDQTIPFSGLHGAGSSSTGKHTLHGGIGEERATACQATLIFAHPAGESMAWMRLIC
ncbi:MAG: hypothetical protein M3440_07200, partial [Chloroflexota bacterium]|nr:hypothetical protein [Chloroflexota bacterium]